MWLAPLSCDDECKPFTTLFFKRKKSVRYAKNLFCSNWLWEQKQGKLSYNTQNILVAVALSLLWELGRQDNTAALVRLQLHKNATNNAKWKHASWSAAAEGNGVEPDRLPTPGSISDQRAHSTQPLATGCGAMNFKTVKTRTRRDKARRRPPKIALRHLKENRLLFQASFTTHKATTTLLRTQAGKSNIFKFTT